jgi:rhodanese-related sulfurtransferase
MKLFIIAASVIIVAMIVFKMVTRKSLERYFQLPADQVLIIDVRSKQEYDSGHFSTAINIPHNLITTQLKQLEPYKRKQIIVYCHSGNRSAAALNMLKQNGFANVVNAGGYSGIIKYDGKQ